MTILVFGQDRGWEFSPQTFERRTFFRFRIPLVDLQLGPTFRGARIPAWNGDFQVQGWLPSQPNTPENWHVIRQDRLSPPPLCDPEILRAYLGQDQLNDPWRVWSREHSALAKVLWPIVAEAAGKELYYVIPDLFDAAKKGNDPDNLRIVLRRFLDAEKPIVPVPEGEPRH